MLILCLWICSKPFILVDDRKLGHFDFDFDSSELGGRILIDWQLCTYILKWRKWPCCRCDEEELEKYGIHLLALSHVYLVPNLKQRCAKAVGQHLTIENVVDVLQLARLCDAPDLYLKCMKLVNGHFKAVQKTEGWKFVQNHDPWLELEILQFIDEAELVLSY